MWRIKGRSEVKHTFGLLMTIIILVAVCAIFVVKMMEVFERRTLTVSEKKNLGDNGVWTTLTTFQNDESRMPVMFAVPNLTFMYNISAFLI